MLHSPVPQLAKTKLSTAEKLYDSAICPAGGHKCLTFVFIVCKQYFGRLPARGSGRFMHIINIIITITTCPRMPVNYLRMRTNMEVY